MVIEVTGTERDSSSTGHETRRYLTEQIEEGVIKTATRMGARLTEQP